MSTSHVRLEALRRKSGGRIHLTPRVPSRGPVTTLCDQTLDAGTYAATKDEADCVNCLRRSRDESRVSGAFFAQDAGSELLRLSLEQARLRRPPQAIEARRAPKASPPPFVPKIVRPAIPDVLGELVTRDFKRAGEGVWSSPDGVVVRLRLTGGRWRFDELVYEGAVVATRTRDGMRIKAGDVEVAPAAGGYEVRVKKV